MDFGMCLIFSKHDLKDFDVPCSSTEIPGQLFEPLNPRYYAEITEIQDHDTCWTKKIPGSIASESFYKGREVPGVASHIFLWTHSGSQGRAEVGLSKINRQEADMAVWLAYYLVECGVPKTSIVILTPYKGQLMLMRKLLLSDQSQTWLLSRDPWDADQIRLSTVDRFQGDEADVVIASLASRCKCMQKRLCFLLKTTKKTVMCLMFENLNMFDVNPCMSHDSVHESLCDLRLSMNIPGHLS